MLGRAEFVMTKEKTRIAAQDGFDSAPCPRVEQSLFAGAVGVEAKAPPSSRISRTSHAIVFSIRSRNSVSPVSACAHRQWRIINALS